MTLGGRGRLVGGEPADLLPVRECRLRGRSLLLGAGEAQRVNPLLALRRGRKAGVAEQPLVVLQERSTCLSFFIVLRWRVNCAPRSASDCDWAVAGKTNKNQGAHTHR